MASPQPAASDEVEAEEAPQPSPSSRWLGLLRFVVGFGLAGVLIRWVVVSGGANLKEEWRQCESGYLTLAFFMIGCGIALSSFRWARLLTVQQVFLSGQDAIRLTMIGQFFNLAIPGGVGGDLIKMIYLRKQAGERTPEAIMTTLFDRILGLMGLFLVAILAVIFSWSFLMQASDAIKYTVTFVGTVSVVGAVGVVGAMYHEVLFQFSWVLALLARLKTMCPAKVWSIARRVVRSVSLFRVHRGEVVLALLVSMTIHTLAALSVWAIGQSFHAPLLRMPDYFLATQIANTISAVPVTPGGMGSRDFVLAMFFRAFGEGPKASVIPPILSLLFVLWSLIGSLFFLFEKQHMSIPLKARVPVPEEVRA